MTTVARRARGTAAGLSRDAVVAAAAAVAERDGFAGMSLRSVAVALGVSPTAIYHHVAGKDELLDAVADAFIARALVEPLPQEPLDRVRELVRRARRAGLEHPGLLTAVVGHVPEQLPSAHVTFAEHLLAALVEAGASEQTAILMYDVIVRLYVGDVVALTNRHAPCRLPLAERVRALTEQTSLPMTARLMSSREGDHDHDFDRQLDAVLSLLHEQT